MPRYGYICEECSENWELTRRIDNRNDPVECPKCSSVKVRMDYSGNSGVCIIIAG